MKTRQLGSTGIEVSELCLGTSTFARFAGQEETFVMLDTFRGAGGNFIQTSGLCPGAGFGDGFLGLPEEFLGRWLGARQVPRREVVIATRIGLARPLLGGARAYGDLMQACVRDSLRRIGTDHLDFLVIEWSEALLPIGESMESAEAIVRDGWARHVVLAHFPAEQLGAVQLKPGMLAGIELDYSLVYRALFEGPPSGFCREHGLAFIARSPLAGGHLVSWPAPDLGSFRWRSAADPFIATCAHAVWPALRRVAARHDSLPAQIAVAWVLAQPAVTSALVSVRSLPQLHELLAATSLHLSRDECEWLESASSLHLRIPVATEASGPAGTPGEPD